MSFLFRLFSKVAPYDQEIPATFNIFTKVSNTSYFNSLHTLDISFLKGTLNLMTKELRSSIRQDSKAASGTEKIIRWLNKPDIFGKIRIKPIREPP